MVQRVPVKVILRGRNFDDGVPPSHEIEGYSLSATCPLAIAPDCYYSKTWVVRREGLFHVYHRRLGWALGKESWGVTDAWRLLIACDPDFPAWHVVEGYSDEPAWHACKAKFRWAKESTGVKPFGRKVTVEEYRHFNVE
jgi:hypothetical protein